MSHARVLYEFGDFVLDTGQRCLLRSHTQTPIPLTGKVFDTLLYLVEHAGDTLDKDELLRSIWPGVIVEENSLTQNISMLRQALGETRGENRYIATIARKGYRFVAKVTPREELSSASDGLSPPPPEAPTQPTFQTRPRSRVLIAGLVLFVAIVAAGAWFVGTRQNEPARAAAQTLAILPFKPLLPAERNESLELGMAQSLIASLGEHSPQRISPLSSVRRYAALEQDPIAAGRELGVDMVLEGSLQRRDDRLRVTVQLLRVADGKQLWAQRFDQNFTTIFEVQDAIAASVAKSLSLHEGGSGSPRTARTVDPEAYALYASGQFAWSRQNEASLLQSISFYQQALERDPKYALAYAGLADSYALLGVFGIRAPNDVFPTARAAVDKALSFDPDLAAAHSALGHIKMMYERDWDGAAREYELALQLDPSLAIAYQRRGLLYAMQGDTERAIAAADRAQAIEPLWLPPRTSVGNFLYYAKRYAESIRVLEQVLALDARADNARAFLIRNLLVTRNYDRALAELDKGPIQMPGTHAHRAQALAMSGRREAAVAELHRVLELSKQRYVPAYDIALIYTALGDTENTFVWLERAMDDRSTLMVFLAQDPSFNALHSDTRFVALVKRVGVYSKTLTR
jgi:DNA-binding winged helix-turn-helix (wHTH) protein/TolB-like protein/Flp pilus assembly protein TadD